MKLLSRPFTVVQSLAFLSLGPVAEWSQSNCSMSTVLDRKHDLDR